MRRITVSVLVLVLAVVVSQAAFAQTSKGGLSRAQADKMSATFISAFEKGDVATVGSLYADDALMFPPDSDIVKGRSAIEAFWKATKDAGAKSIELEILDLQSSGNLAIETGTGAIHMQPANQAESIEKAKYVVVWKRQKDGSWKIIRDIWNGMAPAPAMAQ